MPSAPSPWPGPPVTARIRQADGNLREAREAWERALRILEDLRHPQADQVKSKLAAGQAVRP
jgi:hypothetical protein